MKAPYFDVVSDDGAQTASKLLLEDTRPVKLERRRALNGCVLLYTIGDSFARGCFDEGKDTVKGAYNKRAWLKEYALYFVLAPAVFLFFTAIFTACILWGDIYGTVHNLPVLTVLFTVLWVSSGAAAIVFPVLRVCKDKYLKRVFRHLDTQYIIYDKHGKPCCICVGEAEARVLYGGKLAVFNANGRISEITDPKKVYLEYLSVYPQSVFNMGAFVGERKKYFLADDSSYRKDVYAVFNTFSGGSSLSVNVTKTNVTSWKLHKMLFDFDLDAELTAVYTVAGRGYLEYINLAEVKARGESVFIELNGVKDEYPALAEYLDKYYES